MFASKVVTRPCPLTWESLVGDDRARACAACERTVHAVAALSLGELVRLRAEGACFSVTERPDGRVLTRDGWRRWGAAGAVMAAMAGCDGARPEDVTEPMEAAAEGAVAPAPLPTDAAAPAGAAAPEPTPAEACDEECRGMLMSMGYVE